jgi:hypothetical protein
LAVFFMVAPGTAAAQEECESRCLYCEFYMKAWDDGFPRDSYHDIYQNCQQRNEIAQNQRSKLHTFSILIWG